MILNAHTLDAIAILDAVGRPHYEADQPSFSVQQAASAGRFDVVFSHRVDADRAGFYTQTLTLLSGLDAATAGYAVRHFESRVAEVEVLRAERRVQYEIDRKHSIDETREELRKLPCNCGQPMTRSNARTRYRCNQHGDPMLSACSACSGSGWVDGRGRDDSPMLPCLACDHTGVEGGAGLSEAGKQAILDGSPAGQDRLRTVAAAV